MPSTRKSASARNWLGATTPQGTIQIVFYVPSKDRFEKDIPHEKWVKETLETFGRLFRGATAFPRAQGVWRDDAHGGKLVHENPTIVECYVDRKALNKGKKELRRFLHRLGRETNQGEIGIVIDSKYFGITIFDHE